MRTADEIAHKYRDGRYRNPVQVFDINQIKANVTELGEAIGDIGRLLFAVKSFPNVTVLQEISELGAGFEISSLSEYLLLPEDLSGRTVSLNSPGVTDLEILTSKGNDLHVHVASPAQLDAWTSLHSISFALRLSHTSLGLSGEVLGDERPSRFGSSVQDLIESHELFAEGRLSGVHVHNGSEHNPPEFYHQFLDTVLQVFERRQTGLAFINLGGGFHSIGGNAASLLRDLAIRSEGIPLFIEPGNVVCRNAGYLLCRVVEVRAVDCNRYHVTLDASYECHAKWSFPIWMSSDNLEAVRYPHNIVPEPEAGFQFVQFYGSSCFEQDLMGVYRVNRSSATPLGIGDFVIFRNLNGYSFAWNKSFNGIPCAELCLA